MHLCKFTWGTLILTYKIYNECHCHNPLSLAVCDCVLVQVEYALTDTGHWLTLYIQVIVTSTFYLLNYNALVDMCEERSLYKSLLSTYNYLCLPSQIGIIFIRITRISLNPIFFPPLIFPLRKTLHFFTDPTNLGPSSLW